MGDSTAPSEAIQACKPPPEPETICDKLRRGIDEAINRVSKEHAQKGLKQRFAEQITGELPPGSPGWEGHDQQIKNRQAHLEKLLRQFDRNNCGDPPPGAWNWATRPRPQEGDYKGPQKLDWGLAAKVAGGAAAAYATYRVIRFLPSLFPPLWPTIPANLAVP